MGFRKRFKAVLKSPPEASSSKTTAADAGDLHDSEVVGVNSEASPRPLGIETLDSGKSAIVDIVFVHGLTGHRHRTWTAPGATEPWPKVLLPQDIPNARIITYGYDADATFLNSARGICFLGTPNGGSDFTKFATAVANVISLSIVKRPNAQLLEVLKKRSQVLANVKNGFLTLVRRRAEEGSQTIKLHAFVEELPVAAIGSRVVTPDSAIIPGYNSSTLPYDHMSMSKFLREDDVGYQRVSGKLMDWVTEIDESNEVLRPDVILRSTTQPTSHFEEMNDSKLGDKSLYRYPRRIGKIIYRPDIMTRMTSLLKQDGDSTRVVILFGMGGQGKTMLAINFSREAETRHLFLAIFWLDASSEDTLSKGFVTLSELIKRHEDPLFDTSDGRIQFVRQRIEEWNRPWLLIMDNYDDPGRLPNISNYIPNSRHGSVLVTTRQANLERLGTVIAVPPMSKEESLLLLYDRCGGADKYAGQHELAARIVGMLGCLPLAIEQAAAYIQNRVDLPLAKFIEQYKDRRNTIWSKAPMPWDYKATVYTTWEMSFELIDEEKSRRDEKGKVLTMLSFLDSRGISQEIFNIPRVLATRPNAGALETSKWLKSLLNVHGNWDLLRLEDLLTDLSVLNLIQLTAHKPGAIQISLHPLISDEAKHKSATELLLSVEFGEEVFRHQFACMENLRDLQREDSGFMGQSPFAEPITSPEANMGRVQKLDEAIRTLELDTRERSQSSINQCSTIMISSRNERYWIGFLTISATSNMPIYNHGLPQERGSGCLTRQLFKNGRVVLTRACGCMESPDLGKRTAQHLTQMHVDSACLFFFCNDRHRDVTNARAILCALVRQAASALESISPEVRNSFEQHTRSQTRLGLAEVRRLLFAVVLSRLASAKRIFIVLDALNEIEEGEGSRLLGVLQKLVYTFASSVNIMVTSRVSRCSLNESADFKTIDFKLIELLVPSTDIQAYINKRLVSGSRLARLLDGHYGLELEVREAVVKYSGGMFLLAKMFMDELSTKVTRKAIKSSLKGSPRSHDELYCDSLHRIHELPSEEGHLAVQTLMWLSLAMRPLRRPELQHAIFSMSLESNEVFFELEDLVPVEHLTSLCAGFVVSDQETDLVRLVHYTAAEFFERERDNIYPKAINDITKSCIRYLSLQLFAAGAWPATVIKERLLEYPFATYASKYWVQHAKQNPETLTDETIIEIANFLSTQNLFECWVQILAYVEHQDEVGRDDIETNEPSISSRLVNCDTPRHVAQELDLDARVEAYWFTGL
ncbi:MAG: hypothetical protein Q9171_001917 [Xanthocarpia ochracea]